MERLITTNNEVLDEYQRNGYTIYGAAANALERRTEAVNQIAEKAGAYFAERKAAQITIDYEESRSFFEKYIKNNEIKLRQMEQERAFKSAVTDAGIQAAIKVSYYAAKKTLQFIDDRQTKAAIWSLLLSYADTLTNRSIGDYHTVMMQLLSYYRQLYHPKSVPTELLVTDNQKKRASPYMPRSAAQKENMAQLLYQLFSAKQRCGTDSAEKERDLAELIDSYLIFGFDINAANLLLERFAALDASGVSETDRTARLLQSFFSNLTITLPNIDISRTRRMNNEFRKYVPNGDRQRIGKFVAKTGITAIATAGGLKSTRTVAITLPVTFLYFPSSWRKTVSTFPMTIAGTPINRPVR